MRPRIEDIEYDGDGVIKYNYREREPYVKENEVFPHKPFTVYIDNGFAEKPLR